MSVTLGRRTKRPSDDLSERICAGYWVLRFAGVHGARRHVALALNHHGIPTRSRKADDAWTGAEVAERVKQYEARTFPKSSQTITQARRFLAAKWKASYYELRWAEPPYTPRQTCPS